MPRPHACEASSGEACLAPTQRQAPVTEALHPRATGTQKAPARGGVPAPRGVNQGFVAEKRLECPFTGCPALQVAFRWPPRGWLPRLLRLSPGHEVTLKNRDVLGAHPPVIRGSGMASIAFLPSGWPAMYRGRASLSRPIPALGPLTTRVRLLRGTGRHGRKASGLWLPAFPPDYAGPSHIRQ